MSEQDSQKSGGRDDLFSRQGFPKPFAFNASVAAVFDDMVTRSVPLYRQNLELACAWGRQFFQPNTYALDLGCSTGTLILALARAVQEPLHFVGIDSSEPMIEQAEDKLVDLPHKHRLQLMAADLTEVNLPGPSSLAYMNYTLQFLPVAKRLPMLQRVYQSLAPGGLFWLAEKVRADGPEFHEAMTSQYEAFKMSQGYSRTEIERKKEALENVLVPLTAVEQIDLLRQAGFRHVDVVLRWQNFASFVALK